MRAPTQLAAEVLRLAEACRKRARRLDTLKADAEASDQQLAQESPHYRLSGAENRKRTIDSMIESWTTTRQLVAGQALFDLEPALARLEEEQRRWLAEVRSDALRTYPDALDGYGPVAMLSVTIARELMRPRVEAMNVDELYETYKAALPSATADATANRPAEHYLTLQLIEDRVGRRDRSVTSAAVELPTFHRLSSLIGEVQAARVPVEEATEIDIAIEEARSAVASAHRHQVQAINLDRDPRRKALAEDELSVPV